MASLKYVDHYFYYWEKRDAELFYLLKHTAFARLYAKKAARKKLLYNGDILQKQKAVRLYHFCNFLHDGEINPIYESIVMKVKETKAYLEKLKDPNSEEAKEEKERRMKKQESLAWFGGALVSCRRERMKRKPVPTDYLGRPARSD
jgi:hypothetical protein